MHGVDVTTPIRTLVDVVVAGTLSRDILEQAADDFLRFGLVTLLAVASARELHPALDRLLEDMGR